MDRRSFAADFPRAVRVARQPQLGTGDMDLREWYRLDTGLRRCGIARHAPLPSDPHSALGPGPPPRIRDNDGFDPDHSALWYLISSAPLLVGRADFNRILCFYWGWLARIPHLLSASCWALLWYVARRLYGNEGGFIALMLYCFSPGMIRAASVWYAEPETGAAWGAFGTIFTGIAVAHTLYAPREVVLWNWRRTLLLGVSLALAVGSQFSLFMMAPLRAAVHALSRSPRGAAPPLPSGLRLCHRHHSAIRCLFLQPAAFFDGLRHATWLGFTPQVFSMPAAYRELFAVIGQNSPALVFALPIALATYLLWPRARYFGNTAPLLVAAFCLHPRFRHPALPRLGFSADRHPVPFRVRRRHLCRPAGNKTAHTRHGLHLRTASRVRFLEPGRTGPGGYALSEFKARNSRAA